MGVIVMLDYKKTELWKNVTPEQWADWKWQFKNRIMNADSLKKIIDLSSEEENFLNECLNRFRMAITPYYACLMSSENLKCPIRAQCIPSPNEMDVSDFEKADPLGEEKYTKVPSIVHKYPDRVLFLLTGK